MAVVSLGEVLALQPAYLSLMPAADASVRAQSNFHLGSTD